MVRPLKKTLFYVCLPLAELEYVLPPNNAIYTIFRRYIEVHGRPSKAVFGEFNSRPSKPTRSFHSLIKMSKQGLYSVMSMMIKRANVGLLQANDGKMHVYDGEIQVNDGKMRV